MRSIERLLAKRQRRIVGLMSGTSADGIDAALVEIESLKPQHEPDADRQALSWELLDFVFVPYAPEIRSEILGLQESGAPRILERMTRLHFLLAHLFADAVERLIADAGVPLEEIDAIASHGQTVAHFPRFEARLRESFEHADGEDWVAPATLQIGEPAVLTERLGLPVVSNFRSRDVAAGGTGAPLVPLVDHLLFAHPVHSRLALNVGGIANLSGLRAGGPREDVIAFDTGPGNMVIDAIMGLVTEGKEHLDRGGALARKGIPDREIVASLLEAPFFHQSPPKAAGRGEFGVEYARALLDRCRTRRLTDASTLATATWLTAQSVHDAYRRFVAPRLSVDEVIVSGGGAHNVCLLEYLAQLFEDGSVKTSDYYGLDVDAKEAVAFALLAHLSLDGKAGNLPRVTGAAHPVVLGTLTPADKP
jgi:anhydro-N-acetylmuramic acid kinase